MRATLGLPLRRRVFQLLYIASLAAEVVGLYLLLNMNRVFIAAGATTTPIEAILQVVLNEVLGLLTPIAVIVIGGLWLLRVLFAILMDDDFTRVSERLWCVADRSVREALTAFVRAKRYMKREMWTLAVLYLQRAVSLRPLTVEYYLALAESYAQLGRYQQSLALLDDAAQLQSDSPIIPNLRGVIMEMQNRALAQSARGV